MRKFIIYSKTASTDTRIRDLRSAGRWDIILHSIISALFASNEFRDDVELHIIAMGPPNSPRHILIKFEDGNSISKKDLKTLIEMCMRKCRENGEVREVHKGVFVDNKTIEQITKDEIENKKDVFMLDANGEHIKNIESKKLNGGTFILGDYDGFDKQTKKFLKKNTNRMSLGEQMYFTSQAITIINYELDNL